MNASDADALLAKVQPVTPTQRVRYDVAAELLDDIRRLDAQLKASHKRIKEAVKASGTSVTEIYGIGPMIAAELIGHSGDVRRFANRDAYASYNGTAPVEFSSGGRTVLGSPSEGVGC
jgi:transposase